MLLKQHLFRMNNTFDNSTGAGGSVVLDATLSGPRFEIVFLC
jgi:hypothetical protein